ncbi:MULTISPECIES: L-methionine/branched-chain amino acid transporter [Enterobacter cloacae complex]|uniref:L-methionine/branched-chain amino acid transporter n=1 Tax=Enterobacter cloacae complex TaxID=354276 RepID=UPI000651BFFF|nr:MULTISPECIES: L-methionine/branched-chain amino acid transporter [Enterobacter cloacae complex]KLW38097.1 inner membrane protein YjeH [Enterobacter sp. MGH119]MBT1741153.1 L-methionine/branched-chain amino acid transporter [Enterobacter hormaechei subsp. xiangfangensis]MCW4831712.1 L-methionine/branched-chain amino acid transporter [Enterobacter hormaechei subsp. xiangfangensis]MCW4966805.1 L-methionine/branched-chain amino acid transporter [Enterobacter hormaechei subsp. xiangfangensis]HCM
MSGLRQELGLAQGIGLLSTSLLGTGVFAVPALAALVAGNNSLWAWPVLIVLVFPVAIVFAILGRHFPSAGGVAHFVGMAFGPRMKRVTGWLFLSVIPVGLPAALHIATGFGQALFGWHDEQLLLAEIGTLAIVWWVGSRGASSSANLQTLVAVLIVALIVAIWFAGDITVADIPFPAINDIDHAQLFAALSVMFWCFVGLEAFAHLASEFKQPERDFPRALMIGLMLAGTVYWACTVLVLHFNAFSEEKAAAASLPGIVVQLFGVKALWVACVIGYLACFASLNIYIQSFARLVWSQALYKPDSPLSRLSKRQLPVNALNTVLGCCVVSSLAIYLLGINLDALIVYANGIFIMIYLLCMLAGCRLLKGRFKALAAVGCVLCLMLLAMVGWKSVYAIVMLAGLWVFLPKRQAPQAR